MIAYKLFRERKDGSLGPLFIGKNKKIPLNEWVAAEDIPTKGYAHRPGWHCSIRPNAPHLSEKGRSWFIVEIDNFVKFVRPAHQGGEWLIAQKMKVIKKYPS